MNAHWIIKESGAYCSDCGNRTSTKVVIGEQYWMARHRAGLVKTRFKFCPFCGKPMDEKMEWPDLDE